MTETKTKFKATDVVATTINGKNIVTEIDKVYEVEQDDAERFEGYPHFFEKVSTEEVDTDTETDEVSTEEVEEKPRKPRKPRAKE